MKKKDWGQDVGLNDTNGYTKNSQFTDRDIRNEKVIFTAHSLGGAVASYLAEMYYGETTVVMIMKDDFIFITPKS